MENNPTVNSGKPAVSEFAVASLVIGIISFLNLFGMEKPIAAIVFGILAMKRIKANNLGGKKLAIAGIILGVLAIIAAIVAIIYFLPVMMEQIEQMQQGMAQQ